MRVAFVGCGFAADFYATTLNNHPQLELAGVFDINAERAALFSRTFIVPHYASLEELLADDTITIVVNLTPVSSHYTITRACLEAGKHVYSEKPLALHVEEAEKLQEIAQAKSLHISCAPANLLGETAQTVWKLLRNKTIGRIWLAYAELDDGAVHQDDYPDWRNSCGIPWPFRDEFAMGCTTVHAAYYLGWLTAFFGPARKVSSFSSCLVPDKLEKAPVVPLGDDFSVSCITFSSGVVARLTCSILAPKDHSLSIVGSEGVITVEDCWNFKSPVYLQKRLVNSHGYSKFPPLEEKRLVELEKPEEEQSRFKYNSRMSHDMDFARGIADLADAIQNQRLPRLSVQQAVHITEIIAYISKAPSSSQEVKTSFPELAPMPWAQDRISVTN